MNRRALIGVTAGAVVAAGISRRANAQASAPLVRMGVTPGDPFAEGYYGMDGGFFAKNGLNVESQFFGGGGPNSEAVASGTVDVGTATMIQIANAVTHGIPFVVIAPGCINTRKAPAGFLIVANNSPVRSAKDLEGKTVAISQRRSITELALIAYLQKNHVNPALVKTIEMPFAAMGAALARGTVAAAITVEPSYTPSLKTDGVKFFADVYGAVAPQFLLSAFMMTQDYARKNPDVVKRFTVSILEVSRWANRNRAETGKILVKYFKLDPDTVGSMVRAEYAEALRPSDIQATLDLAAANGVLTRPMMAAELLYHA